jgi:hypothetical protein
MGQRAILMKTMTAPCNVEKDSQQFWGEGVGKSAFKNLGTHHTYTFACFFFHHGSDFDVFLELVYKIQGNFEYGSSSTT